MSGTHWTKSATRWTQIAVTTYLLAQVLTGFEVGIAAALMVLWGGWSLPAALAVAIPAGFPLMLAQAGGIAWFFHSLQARRQPSLATVPA